jgi:hypothetical protein
MLELVTMAAAIAGISTVAVGLALAEDAFRLLYDRERKSIVTVPGNGAPGAPGAAGAAAQRLPRQSSR